MTFKKGQSGNPNGRPKKEFTLSNLLREELDKVVEVSQKGKKVKMTNIQLVINRLFAGVRMGEKWAIEMIWDRIEGKAQQTIESTGTLAIQSTPKIVFSEPKKEKKGKKE